MKGARQIITFDKHSFRECVEKDENLVALRAEYVSKSAEEQRMAADWEYHSAIAGSMFNDALTRVGQADPGKPYWPEGVLALAIDPLFAPAILTVGSVEYQLGRQDEAMGLFVTLTILPADEPDLLIIIDKAGDFLLDAEDYERAHDLYAAAEKAFPDVAAYPTGLSYCLGRLGLHEEAVAWARRADELAPGNHLHLNDLGWTLYQAGYLEEAEATLEKSVSLAPPDYELARNNLEEVRVALHGKRARDRGRCPPLWLWKILRQQKGCTQGKKPCYRQRHNVRGQKSGDFPLRACAQGEVEQERVRCRLREETWTI